MRRFGFILFVLFCLILYKSCYTEVRAGSRPEAMSNAFVAMYDLWAAFHNQAGLARINRPAGGISTKNHFLLPEIQTTSLMVSLPVHHGVMGFMFSSSGHADFKESKAGLAYALNLGPGFAAGVQLSYLHFSIGHHLGSKGRVISEAGLITRLLPDFYLGVHILNPFNAKLLKTHEVFFAETVPGIFRTGIAWLVSGQLGFTAEVYKDSRYAPRFKAGIEYQPINHVFIRTGLATNPMANSFGFGFRRNQFQIDVSTSYHHILGYSPALSMQYKLK